MILGKLKFGFVFIVFSLLSLQILAQSENIEQEDPMLTKSIEILKRYFYGQNQWYVAKPSLSKDVKGLIDFVENEPVDTIIRNVDKTLTENESFVFRLPEDVEDSLSVAGFYPYDRVLQDLENTESRLQNRFQKTPPPVPERVLSPARQKVDLIPEGNGIKLFVDSVYLMPARLHMPEVIPDSVLNSPEKFAELVKKDSLRMAYIEQKRINYNDSILTTSIETAKSNYRKQKLEEELQYESKRLRDSVKVNNYNLLRAYNEMVVNAVNDSIALVLGTLADYADFIDSTEISIFNLSGRSTNIPLKTGDERFARVWLKNVQQDSLGVIVKSLDKRSIYMLIDDGVTISHYKPKQTKEFDFSSLGKSITSLTDVGKSYEIQTPWVLGGNGNIGFSQTYQENWKKGGQSALSSIIVLKGFARYTRADGKVRWDNAGEFRNGWIRPGGEDAEMQKNDDKIEFTSRFGVSAFKKWYYSSEFNYETQFFKGYKYPTKDHPTPISTFMSPARTFYKIGMEYKPNNQFSMLLSPLTLKHVYVKDTALIDQTKFGIDADKKSFSEPGLNADLTYKRTLATNITYETKYKMFINYKDPFTKFDVNWENLFEMKLNSHINLRFLLHMIYDDRVTFPIYDKEGEQIGAKPKIQIKEYFSIGFSYSLNHKVMKSKRIR